MSLFDRHPWLKLREPNTPKFPAPMVRIPFPIEPDQIREAVSRASTMVDRALIQNNYYISEPERRYVLRALRLYTLDATGGYTNNPGAVWCQLMSPVWARFNLLTVRKTK